MNKQFIIYLATGSLLELALSAHAQVTFRVGPKVGLNVTTARFAPNEQLLNQGIVITNNTSYQTGLEVGVIGSIGFSHFLVQPAILYSQKGYRMHGTQSNVQSIDGTIPAPYEYTSRLSYLTVPLNFTYAQHANGQGFQVFAGPYLGLLVGGDYLFTLPASTIRTDIGGEIKGGNYPADYNGFNDHNVYSRRLDAGLQAGIGYQWGLVLAQACYSVGLRNLAPSNYAIFSFIGNGPDCKNQGFQVSLGYLFGPKG